MADHNELGKEGEKRALEFLNQKGYKIHKTNFRYLKHEVDIIAEFNNEIIAIEVKTRSTRDFGDPQDFVKPTQIKSIVTALNFYIQKNDIDLEARLDVIAIITVQGKFEIEHIEDAFLSF